MRPDEHKKKRSAQYQKKHGGGSKGKDDNKGVKSGKQGSSKAGGASAKDKGHAQPAQKPTPTLQNIKDADISTSDSEDEGEATVQHKTFRRREITTNWAKYDLPTVEAEESTVTQRGKDVNKLLETTGSAVAHFRFKDEQNWDDGAGDGGQDSHILSLDCNQLADSLDCLPLYTQLQLDKDIFLPEQLSSMDDKAAKHRAAAGLPPLDQETTQDVGLDSASSVLEPLPTFPQAPDKVFAGSSNEQNSHRGAQNSARTNSPKDSFTGSAELDSTKDKTLRSNTVKQTAGFSDADLDSLLEGTKDDAQNSKSNGVGETVNAFGASSGTNATDAKSSSVAVPTTSSAGVTEQDLDDLLAMETPSQSVDSSSTHSSNKAKDNSTAAESAELEDWLDSVLDS